MPSNPAITTISGISTERCQGPRSRNGLPSSFRGDASQALGPSR